MFKHPTMRTSLLFLSLAFSISVFSQEDLLSLVDDKKDEGPKKVYATFKTYKLGNAQTIETVKKNNLDFRISHRFGNVYDMNYGDNALNEAAHTYFGFDNSSDIRWSLYYQ